MRASIAELKRRRNFQVAAVYVVVAWVSMQVIAVMTPALHLPDWVDSFFAIAFIAGFPIAMILAWVFDVTSEGIERTDDVAQETADGDGQHTNKSKDKNATVRVIAISAVGILSMIALWYSPLGKTFMTSPETRSVENGLELVQNFAQKNAIADAQEIFTNILADDPDHAAARAGLAIALMREYTHLERDPALLQRAKSLAAAALRSDEHLALANVAVGWSAEFEGDFEEAHKSYDLVDILDSNNKFAIEGRARTYIKSNRHDDAQSTLDKGIELNPDYPLFYTLYGESLSYQNRIIEAEDMFRRAKKVSVGNPRVYAQLAHTLHMQDKTTEAIEVLQDGLEVNETALLYSNLGSLLFFKGQYELAAGAFERSIDLAGDSHDYLYWANLADTYRWVPGRSQDAYTAYDRALQLLATNMERHPNNRTYLSQAALYNAKRGFLDKSRQILSQINFTDPVPTRVLYRATVIYEILADRKQALAMLDRAIEAGYPMTEILNDPELAQLRQDLDYHRLIATRESEL